MPRLKRQNPTKTDKGKSSKRRLGEDNKLINIINKLHFREIFPEKFSPINAIGILPIDKALRYKYNLVDTI